MLSGTPLRERWEAQEGFLNRRENSCYLYRVLDVELQASLFERMFGLGTIVCHCGDATHPVLKIEHIKNSKAIHTSILEASEAHRIRRRTLNVQDIAGGGGDFGELD